MDIIQTIQSLENMRHLEPATDEQIETAQQVLGLKFCDEYISYLKTFGAVRGGGITLTGITSSARLSVVEVTLREREEANFPRNMYVVEDTGIEGILILQDEAGTVFELQPGRQAKTIASSLCEYIDGNCI